MNFKLLIIGLFTFSFAFGQSQQSFFNKADVFFKMYTKDGRVNYEALRENSAPLNELVDYIATQNIDKRTEKAYLINVYNILVIDQLVKNNKLVKEPTAIAGFFENKSNMLEGMKVSLNQIENELIRPVYKDPRVHFVLVCGGLGCPPIAGYAYRPEKLDAQLEYQTKIAMNNSDFVYEQSDKKSIFLSQIFDWYQGDFGNSQADVVAFINNYRENKFNTDFKVKYYTYDWTINKATFPIIPVELELEDEMPAKDAVYNPADNNNQPPVKNDLPATVDTETTVQGTQIATPPSDEINLQTFTAGSLLSKGKFDFTLFNTLYTEDHQNWQGNDFSGYRQTFVTNLLQVTYGITENKRINVGLDINFKNSGFSSDSTYGGIGQAFTYQNDSNSRAGITSVGARIKIQPFKSVNNFSIQSTIFIPTIKAPEGFNDPNSLTRENDLFWAEWDRITWWNQFFMDKTFGKFQLFAEVDFLFRFKRFDSQIGMLDMPISFFASYFPTKKITLYAMTQHLTRFTNNINDHDPIVTDFVIPANYTASGFGFKYQLLPNLNIEALYTNFWRGQNSGLGETFNIGVKFLTR